MDNKRGQKSLDTYCKENNKDYLLQEWDYEQNEISPSNISYGSHKVVCWKCPQGHKYKKDIHSRCQGTGCSKCSGINFKKREKIFVEHPELIGELDTEKNTYEDLKNLTCCSIKKVFWKCPNGHRYSQSILNKIHSKGCIICTNKVVLVGYNDCETWCKNNNKTDILKDWDYSLNKKTPKEIVYGSQNLVFFKCHICGYKWKTTLQSRTIQNTGCRECSTRIRSSFPEQAVYYYISKSFTDSVNGDRKILNGKELDIFIPSRNIAIEYDGETWHKSIEKDIEKSKLCKEKNIKLIRIRENKCPFTDDKYSKIYYYQYQNWSELNNIIKSILLDLEINDVDINIERDEIKIKEQYYSTIKDKSLSKLYPAIAAEWHPTKNGEIRPDQVSAETHDSYYWKCSKCGNVYKAMVKNRVRVNSGCPVCGKEKNVESQKVKVRNIDTNEIFDSVVSASEKYKCSRSSITSCCRGITKSAQGYRWEYVDREKSSRKVRQHQKSQKRILNIDTGQIYNSLLDAFEKTGIHNIQTVCSGKREKAGGYHWKYLDDKK